MFLSSKNIEFFYSNASFFSTRKLHALDEYWNNNRSHPTHQQIHEIIEIHLIQRVEKKLESDKIMSNQKPGEILFNFKSYGTI